MLLFWEITDKICVFIYAWWGGGPLITNVSLYICFYILGNHKYNMCLLICFYFVKSQTKHVFLFMQSETYILIFLMKLYNFVFIVSEH